MFHANTEELVSKPLKLHLFANGWSYRRAAKELGVDYTHLCQVVNGHRESLSLKKKVRDLGQSVVLHRRYRALSKVLIAAKASPQRKALEYLIPQMEQCVQAMEEFEGRIEQ